MFTEQLKQMKERCKLTNQQIADISKVPLSTVNRILSGQTDNPSFETISSLVKAMGGSLDEMTELTKKGKESSNELVDLYREIIRSKDKSIKVLAISLAAMVGVLVFILLFDLLHGGIGFIRY